MLDIVKEFETLVKEFIMEGVDYALCGGLAMAIYNHPRATADIDILTTEEDLSSIRRILHKLGFSTEATPMLFNKGTIRIYRFTKLEEDGDDFLPVDILIVTDKNRSVWENRKSYNWNGILLHVVSREGLIQLKLDRNSKQDQADILKLQEEGNDG